MTIYIVYKTDKNHSYASREIIGVATSENKAISICRQQVKKEGDKIDKEQLCHLLKMNQTQGYSGEGEFQLGEFESNKLLSL